MDLIRACNVGWKSNILRFLLYSNSFWSINVHTSWESAQLNLGKGDSLHTWVQMFLNLNWDLRTTSGEDLTSNSGERGSLGTRVQVVMEEFSDIGINWFWKQKITFAYLHLTYNLGHLLYNYACSGVSYARRHDQSNR